MIIYVGSARIEANKNYLYAIIYDFKGLFQFITILLYTYVYICDCACKNQPCEYKFHWVIFSLIFLTQKVVSHFCEFQKKAH